ncbi:C39 family peptidase [Neobacillus rhizosphaerae]|uniref:C39 family peptidase n=1 Tax=Neobacillus rhizosphaerae TaxID=2880965 RepID=UPI003D2C16F2
MKKLCLVALLLPMFGCSHFNAYTNSSSNIEKTESRVPISKNSENKTQTVPISNKSTTITNVKEQLINVKNKPINSNSVSAPPKKNSTMLNVVLIKQNPELRYGCEVTSLAMVLNYAGVKTNKMDLYRSIKKDPDPIIRSTKGDILRWGNPADGFVGDMTGRRAGYAVFDKPMIALINQKLPGRAVNLTNQPFEKVLEHVAAGFPVVVWTTGDYRLPDRWEGWYHGKQYIKTPLDLHAVVLVGFDANNVYLNDPLSGRKQVRVGKTQFISSWKALQSRAVSYK